MRWEIRSIFHFSSTILGSQNGGILTYLKLYVRGRAPNKPRASQFRRALICSCFGRWRRAAATKDEFPEFSPGSQIISDSIYCFRVKQEYVLLTQADYGQLPGHYDNYYMIDLGGLPFGHHSGNEKSGFFLSTRPLPATQGSRRISITLGITGGLLPEAASPLKQPKIRYTWYLHFGCLKLLVNFRARLAY